MKLSLSQLKKIIKEEVTRAMNENAGPEFKLYFDAEDQDLSDDDVNAFVQALEAAGIDCEHTVSGQLEIVGTKEQIEKAMKLEHEMFGGGFSRGDEEIGE